MIEIILKKFPRSFLVTLTASAMAACFFFIKYEVGKAYADTQTATKTAFEAKHTAETLSMQVAELRGVFQDMKNTNEKFHNEYREDQHRLEDKLDRLLPRP